MQYVRGVHALIPCVESAVELAGTRWKPRCPEMCRGGGAEKPSISASFQGKIIGRVHVEEYVRRISKIDLTAILKWYRGVFSWKNCYFNQTSHDVFSFRQSV